MNTIGRHFRLTTFGESHGAAIGGVIDGCPSNIRIDYQLIENELRRRATAMNEFSSQRNEADKVKFLSGILDGVTLGTPIAFMVENTDAKPEDYAELEHVFRPSHADFTYQAKYGIRDHRGGGRASARTTLPIVVAGAVAKQILKEKGIAVQAYTKQIGSVALDGSTCYYESPDVLSSEVYCPDKEATARMLALIEATAAEGDTLGGVVGCCIHNMPAGVGEPMFDKMQARLAHAMLSIPSAKGFEYGDGYGLASMKGSEANDVFVSENGKIRTAANHSGGIQGGITNGEDVVFNVAFKPIPSIRQVQKTVTDEGTETYINIGGRHDVCAVPRAVVIVEALAAIVIVDLKMCGG